MIGLIKLHTPSKLHEYIIFTFLFTDHQNARSNHFVSILGGYQVLLPQMRTNSSKIFASDSLQGNASHMCRLLMQSENSSKKCKKTDFLAQSKRVFIYALLYLMSYIPIMWQMIDLMKIHNISKFDQYSFCGWQVISFQSFSYQFSIYENALFSSFCFFFWGGRGRVLGPNSPKYCLILLMFALEVVLKKKKTAF